MARYDVYANPEADERAVTPYLVDIQNDYIDGLPTRVVIPLRASAIFPLRARNLNPSLTVLGDAVVLDTAAMGAVPLAELRRPVANLGTARPAIQEALDTLFGSF